MNTKILEEIGLTNGEIKVYLALLKLGSSSTGPIAKESGVSRAKIYIILDKLEKKGLCSHVAKNNVMNFQAVEPKKIMDYLIRKEEKLKSLGKEFEKFLPDLESYQKSGKTSHVMVYQGMKGLMTSYEHMYLKLKKGDEYVVLGIPAEQPEPHHLYWQKDHQRRTKAKFKCRLLFNKDTTDEILINRNSFWGCDARRMPLNINSPSFFSIYADTVLISMSVREPISIEIISQEIANAFKAYFNEFWKQTKPFKVKKISKFRKRGK